MLYVSIIDPASETVSNRSKNERCHIVICSSHEVEREWHILASLTFIINFELGFTDSLKMLRCQELTLLKTNNIIEAQL